jgi:hypothetical protein
MVVSRTTLMQKCCQNVHGESDNESSVIGGDAVSYEDGEAQRKIAKHPAGEFLLVKS